MIKLSLLDLLFDFQNFCFEIGFFTIEFPVANHFVNNSFLAIGYYNGEWLVELFFILLVGEKKYD